MKKALKILFLLGVSILSTSIPSTYAQVSNNVPAYYYANYKFIDDWTQIWDIFRTIQARRDV
ncbi:hypothetical protein IJL65_02700 [bacterium]|nr:hypothetical protein [bacterium]